MNHSNGWIGAGVVASVLVFGIGVFAATHDRASTPNASKNASLETAAAVGPSDFSGVWKLDRAKSDAMRGGLGGPRGGDRPEGMNDGPPRDRGDRGSLTEGMRGERGGRSLRRGARLPATFTIEAEDGVLFLSDSTGTLVQQIATGTSHPDTAAAPVVRGTWKPGGLEIVRQGWGGRTSTETWSLSPDRASLVILTRMESDQGAREFKRVYARAGR